MEKKITTFTKEWEDLELHKVREITHGVNVILEKGKGGIHISVHLEGLYDVPVMFQYGLSKSAVLIHSGVPIDYDGTEEDRDTKIAEVIAEAEIIYEGINEEQIINLQDAIKEYRDAERRIYSAKSQMRG